MALDMMNPGAKDAGARELVIAGELDGPENSLDLHRRQAARLVRCFRLEPRHAALVAELYYGVAA